MPNIVSPQLAELLEVAECCCPKLCQALLITTTGCLLSFTRLFLWPLLSVPRPGRVGHLKQSSVFTGGNPSHGSNQHASTSQTTPLISDGVIKLKQRAIGKRRPDKHRVDWDIGVTQVRCSQGLLTPIAVSRFCLKSLNRRLLLRYLPQG